MSEPERLDRRKSVTDWEAAEREVMKKVIDIDTPGTAYTHLNNAAKLESILTSGILGQTQEADMKNKPFILDPLDWAKQLRRSRKVRGTHARGKEALSVYFNIVGRSEIADFGGINPNGREPMNGRIMRVPEIMNSEWSVRSSSEFVLIFSIDRLTEVQPDYRDEPQDLHTYRANDGGKYWHYTAIPPKDEQEENWRAQALALPKGPEGDRFAQDHLGGKINEDLPTPSSEWGFKLTPRVPSRDLRGIIIKLDHDYKMEESWARREVEPKYQAEMQQRLSEVIAAQRVAFGDNPERSIPIYDFLGNLLWPKEMSWDDVKAMVAQRAAGETEDDSSTE